MSKIVLDVPNEYKDLFKDLKELEACFRNNKKRFNQFLKLKVREEPDLEDVYNNIVDFMQKSEKTLNHSISMVKKSTDEIKDTIGDIDNAVDAIMSNGKLAKALSFINIALSVADICATVAGFVMISEHLDEIAKELSEVRKDVKDLVQHQELLDQKEVNALIHQYANILNKEAVGDTPTVDEYYELVDKMSLTMNVIGECFKKNIGNRQVYLDAISALLPIYEIAIWKFDRAHYFTYGRFHINRDTYVKTIDQFTNFDFFEAVQEFVFLNKGLSQREAFDAAYAFIGRIKADTVFLDDNVTILKHFNSKEEYEEFEKAQNREIVNYAEKLAFETSDENEAVAFCKAIEKGYESAFAS